MIASRLSQATIDLYDMFSGFPLKWRTSEILWNADELAAKPLSRLSHEDLEWVIAENFVSPADMNCLRYLVPRMLELVAMHYLPENRWEALQMRNPYCRPGLLSDEVTWLMWRHGFGTWPTHEQSAVHTFGVALLEALLSTNWRQIAYPGVGRVLLDFAVISHDLTDFIQTWNRNVSANAALCVADLLIGVKDDLLAHNQIGLKDNLCGRCYDPQQGKQIAEWLAQPGIRHRLESAFFEVEGSKERQLLSDAVDWYDRWQEQQAGLRGPDSDC